MTIVDHLTWENGVAEPGMPAYGGSMGTFDRATWEPRHAVV